jgi:hypothetical protein
LGGRQLLTLKDILRSAQMMQSYGELRPGFLDHDAARLQGPTPIARRIGADASSDDNAATLRITRDDKSGEYRFEAK